MRGNASGAAVAAAPAEELCVRADAVARARERTGARAYAPTHDIPTTLSALTYDSTYDIICESIL